MAKTIPSYIEKRLALDDLTRSRGLLRLIDQKGPISQLQAAKGLGVSPGTCNLHFQKLEYMGLICRVDEIRKGRGRSTILWELDNAHNACLAFIFDVPFFQATLVDFNGKILDTRREDLTGVDTRQEVEDHIDAFTANALALAKEKGLHIRQTFAGVPGILDHDTGAVIRAVNFPALNGIDLKNLMRERYGLKCISDSLGLAFYHGEIEHLPPKTRTMVIYWDLGIGGVAGVGGRVLSHGHADTMLAELGHVRIERDGRPCHCGRQGCLEAYAGGWALIGALGHLGISCLEDLIDAVSSGQPEALAMAKQTAGMLGRHLVWPLQVMQSERLIISGPLAAIFPDVEQEFRQGLATLFNDVEIDAFNPAASSDPQRAMQRGAHRLARRLFLNPRNT